MSDEGKGAGWAREALEWLSDNLGQYSSAYSVSIEHGYPVDPRTGTVNIYRGRATIVHIQGAGLALPEGAYTGKVRNWKVARLDVSPTLVVEFWMDKGRDDGRH